MGTEIRTTRRTTVSALLGVIGLAAVSAISPHSAALAQQADWPQDRITLVVPFNAGGSADRLARGLASFLPYELNDVPVTVINKPGGSGALGATWFANQPADGSHFLVMQATPYLANAILLGGAPVEWEDFDFINNQWTDRAILAVPKDSPYQTFEELATALKEPGKVSAGTIWGSGAHIQTIALLDALGIPHDNLRLVTFDGGGPLRTALAGGQVDFEIVAGEGSEVIRDSIRPLAVINPTPIDAWDAPPINEILEEKYGTKVPLLGGNIIAVIARKEFKEQHPERYQTFVDAYKRTLEREDAADFLSRSNIGAEWVGPEESARVLDENFETLKQYTDVVKQ